MLVALDWAEPVMFLLLNVTCSCIFHANVPFFSLLLILLLIGTLLFVFLSLSLSFKSVCAWHPSASLLHPRTLFVLGHHHFPLILPLYMSGFVMRRPRRTSRRTFLDVAFIQNARSSFWIFLILTYSLSFIVGFRSPFVTSRSTVPL